PRLGARHRPPPRARVRRGRRLRPLRAPRARRGPHPRLDAAPRSRHPARAAARPRRRGGGRGPLSHRDRARVIDPDRNAALSSRRARGPMPEPTPRDPVLAMRRQLARVRWRKNLYELQRALYALIAVAALAASAGVLLALRAGATGFAVGASAIAV